MSSETRAFAAIDAGTATTGVSLIARVEGAWRLLGSTAASSAIPVDALIDLLAGRLAAADPDLGLTLGLSAAEAGVAGATGAGPRADERGPSAAVDWPRVGVATGPPPRLAVVAATDRAVTALARTARAAGWDAVPASIAGANVLEMANLLLRQDVVAVLAGASDPAGGDERNGLSELAALVAAAARRRPDLTVILAGAVVEHEAALAREAASDAPENAPVERSIVVGPAATAGDPAGEPLRALLDGLAHS
ncbi:MAG TPA: hypothetical protein VGK63_00960, partial [Candidatus Limnocylindrales bacterium]